MTQMVEQLRAAIQRRIDTCNAEGNATQAKKWGAELKALTAPANAAALEQIAFEPSMLDSMAIYVAQKVRRFAASYAGAGKIDPYSETVLANARALEGVRFDGKLMRAALTPSVKTDVSLVAQRKGTDGTASTQVSSTRQALLAMGAAKLVGAGKGAALEIDFSHPFVAKAVGA